MECFPEDLHRARAAAERACRHLVPSREDAEDCASEAITWALSHPESLQCVANVEGWLVTVARRKAIDMARDAGRRQRSEGRLTSWEHTPESDHAEAVADQSEAAWVARRAQAALPARTHSVLSALASGESVAEAAESLRLTPRAVESHLLRARRRMRTILTIASGVLGVLGSAVRRSGPASVPVAVAAFSIVIGLQQASGDPSSNGSGPGSGARAVVTLVGAHVRPASLAPAPVARALPAAHQHHARQLAEPSRSTVAKVGTPAGSATVQSENRGGDDGAVAAVMGCLKTFTVSPDQIGC